MAPELSPASGVVAQLKELLGLGAQDLSLETLERLTRQQLLAWADRLGLTGVRKLTKVALAGRLESALQTLGVVPATAESSEPTAASRKFAVGRRRGSEGPPEQIPWGYGYDRVTAMAIDPDRLFVYWEVSDDAIARARDGLGAAGDGAWLDVRVYDVTGRLFDGTNAHGYFDQKVERSDRQWFFDVGKPTSAVCVEVGMRSHEGYFVRIVRSGRVDFPRKDPSPSGDVEWLTVRDGGGGGGAAPVVPGGGAAEMQPQSAPVTSGDDGQDAAPHETWVPHPGWTESQDALTGMVPAARTTWQAGPFEHPVEVPMAVERHEGAIAVARQNGQAWVVYGPWEVRIRGLESSLERRIIATWEVSCSWVVDEHDVVVTGRNGAAGHAVGASERLMAGSELRLRGASERWMAGASERRLQGSSEWQWTGGSAGRYGGASEQSGVGNLPNPPPPKR
jgi:hypothetical protein